MHPVFARKWFFAYLATWIFFGLALAGLLRMPGMLTWRESIILAEPLCLLYAFVCLTPWYMCRRLPSRASGLFKLVANHVAGAILVSTFWAEVAQFIAYLLGATPRLRPQLPHLIVVGLLLYSLSVALHYMLIAVQRSRESELQARDAELRALKAQINPHFLFNSLNSITALTMVDPNRAREMCIHLSDFLRNTLGLGEKESIPWRDELQLARTYLEVEQIRFGARLRVEMNVDDECAECMVPPLVLQPLIENAVKHGIASMVEGGTIKVEGRVEDGFLQVSVENGFDPDSPPPRRQGIGLRNVRSRLETRFGSEAKLTAQSHKNQFRAEFTVPCRRES
jgi:two-component system sensor histidine kinase AlgZ